MHCAAEWSVGIPRAWEHARSARASVIAGERVVSLDWVAIRREMVATQQRRAPETARGVLVVGAEDAGLQFVPGGNAITRSGQRAGCREDREWERMHDNISKEADTPHPITISVPRRFPDEPRTPPNKHKHACLGARSRQIHTARRAAFAARTQRATHATNSMAAPAIAAAAGGQRSLRQATRSINRAGGLASGRPAALCRTPRSATVAAS